MVVFLSTWPIMLQLEGGETDFVDGAFNRRLLR